MKEVVKNIILENQDAELPELSTRNLEVPLHTNIIVSLIGARRSGKTYILYHLIKKLYRENVSPENILFINFEDERLKLESKDLDIILQAYQELYPDKDLKSVYFFFDEIQNIPGWEKFIRRIFDTKTRNIFITGSNSKLLSTEIATELRGRTLPFTVFPLSFQEYLRFNNADENLLLQKNKSRALHLAGKFMNQGGFPETIFFDQKNQIRMHQQYFNVMIFKDIIERYKIPDPEMLKFFIKKIFANVTKPLSVNRAYNELKSMGYKISNKYLYEYLAHCHAVFLTQTINKFHFSEIKQEKSDKKAYIIDNGLLSAVEFNISQNRGKLFENMIAMEFLKSEKELFYFKDRHECDFVVKENTGYLPVQSAYSIEDESTLQRELKGIYEACRYLGVKKGAIITFDEEYTRNYEGMEIDIIPFYKYFLGTEG
ncbi:MAG: ATP-binding protein [Cyclobacteriaceae bacterium]|nr:ATP-binding protein [Cyclobacteriaceae bacterium]